MILRDLIRQSEAMLDEKDKDCNVAKVLFYHLANMEPHQLYLMMDEEVDEELLKQFQDGMQRYMNGEPIQYINGKENFFSRDFIVNENVLIPRQDTETLVEEVIKISKKIGAKKILDLCTGSGAIAVSLAKYIEKSQITAVDISKKALNVAKMNAKNNEVENKITFVESDLFNNIKKEKYDIIVSNPPYIKKEVLKSLDKEVQKEPKLALDGGYDGLDFYRKIINKAEEYLKFNGYLCFEIGYDQKEDVEDLLKNEEKYTNIQCIKDLCDNDRVIIAKLN